MTYSFMIVKYENLDVKPDFYLTYPNMFYYDPLWQENGFTGSTNESNCGVPGQFVFQLNKIKQITESITFFLRINQQLFLI